MHVYENNPFSARSRSGRIMHREYYLMSTGTTQGRSFLHYNQRVLTFVTEGVWGHLHIFPSVYKGRLFS